MSTPHVFVASTCYDLSVIRDDLRQFLLGFGCQPIVSELGDVFYDAAIHSHQACLQEVSQSDALVLIIGGRYGGQYKDTDTSITYQEYLVAATHHIPIFALISKSVLHDHHTWIKNNKRSDITYPNTDNTKIFDFIDNVRKHLVNNAFHPFENSQDICDYLTKQFAGALSRYFNRYSYDQRILGLDALGITRVYVNATGDNDYFDSKLTAPQTSSLFVLAVNAEMLIRNRRSALVRALANGCELEFLLASEASELVREMEAMEIADGRRADYCPIPQLIADSEPGLKDLLSGGQELYNELKPANPIGTIKLGFFNTQFRETMILINSDWVWWTPHLNPARGDERPTFVAEGEKSKFVRWCMRHYQAVRKTCEMKTISSWRDDNLVPIRNN